MENASKALLMAGGVLLSMLVISFLIYAWGKISEYKTSQESLAQIEDTAEFNEQFTNYDRSDVLGYELLSLINQVVDYNTRYSNTSSTNDQQYNPITLTLDFGSKELILQKFTYVADKMRLFTSKQIVQSDASNALGSIITTVNGFESKYGSDISQIAKAIDSIFLSDNQINAETAKGATKEGLQETALKKFNSLSTVKYNTYTELVNSSAKEDMYAYYEYMQFKRGIFKCTDIGYDGLTGRVNKIIFTFTGEIY